MNKNTLLAFSLILLTLLFFNSPLYNTMYEKITKKPRVSHQLSDNQNTNIPSSGSNEKAFKKDTNSLTKPEVSFKQNIQNQNSKMPSPQHEEIAGDTIWVENENLKCGISEIGAKIISIEMKKYHYSTYGKASDTLVQPLDLVTNGMLGGANLMINGQDYDVKKFIAQDKQKRISLSKNENKTINFLYKAEDNTTITKQFSFSGNSYKIGFSILNNALDGKSIVVGWKAGIAESEENGASVKSASGVNEPRKVHVLDANNNVTHFQLKKVDKEEESGFYKWAAITSKYFMVALVADTAKNTDLLIESTDATLEDKNGKKGTFALNYEIQMRRSGDGNKESFWIYAGPTQYKQIKSYKEHFEKVLFGGWAWLLGADVWFPFICQFTLGLLISINSVIKDYGIAILILTLLIRIITYPLSQSSMRSMSRMKDLQPKINHLRERYKSNPKKMNEEIMALYKQEGVNPFNPGGCLPMFLQMPILFALFVVLRKAIELRGAHTILIPWVKDLSQPESLMSLTNIFPNGIPMYGSSIALLPIIMAILTFFQNKMTIKDPNQKMMIYFMPVFMLVLFNNFPAGLVLYWTFSNALGIVQQVMLEKSLKKPVLETAQQQKQIGKKTDRKK